MHRFTGKGEGGKEGLGEGEEGRGWEGVGTSGACLWELWSWCSSCVEPSSSSSCTDSQVSGKGVKEGDGEGEGKKGLGDKRCMLVGVVVLVFIMCGAVIAIFMHRFTGEGGGWGWVGGKGKEEGVGRKEGKEGRWETRGTCLWELWF